jgi:hypothetical protein
MPPSWSRPGARGPAQRPNTRRSSAGVAALRRATSRNAQHSSCKMRTETPKRGLASRASEKHAAARGARFGITPDDGRSATRNVPLTMRQQPHSPVPVMPRRPLLAPCEGRSRRSVASALGLDRGVARSVCGVGPWMAKAVAPNGHRIGFLPRARPRQAAKDPRAVPGSEGPHIDWPSDGSPALDASALIERRIPAATTTTRGAR